MNHTEKRIKLTSLFSSKEIIELFRFYVSHEQESKSRLAKIIRDSGSDLLTLSHIEASAQLLSHQPRSKDDLTFEIRCIVKGLMECANELYPAFISLIDPWIVFNSFRFYKHREKSKLLKVNSQLTSKVEISEVRLVSCYILFEEIIQFLLSLNESQLSVNINLIDEHIKISISRNEKIEVALVPPPLALQLVKAHMVYLDCSISNHTDWANVFDVFIPLNI